MYCATLTSASLARPLTVGKVRSTRRVVVAATPSDRKDPKNRAGIWAGFKSWPPEPITESGRPKPEDDPLNYDGEKRVKGPSDEEIKERRAKQAENSPWSKDREGGTQAGGGGEGSAS